MNDELEPNLMMIENTDDVVSYRPRYASTPLVESLPDETVLVKYFDEFKFQRFVRSSALYCRRHDLLRKIDQNEGKVSQATIDLNITLAQTAPELAAQNDARRGVYERVWLANAYIACFGIGNVESSRMYEEYVGRYNGVAVFTTCGALRALCGDGGAGRTKDVVMAPVQYIDMNRTPMKDLTFDFPAFYKDAAFSWERELRFMVRYRVGGMYGDTGVYGSNWPEGEYCTLHLPSFVDKIVLAPQSRDGYHESVKELAIANGFETSVEWSSLPRVIPTW
jgi:hypothetical protein